MEDDGQSPATNSDNGDPGGEDAQRRASPEQLDAALQDILKALDFRGTVDASTLASIQDLATDIPAAIRESVRTEAVSDLELEDIQRNIAGVMPALIASNYLSKSMDSFDLDEMLTIDALPKWVRVEADSLADLARHSCPRRVSDAEARAAIANRDAVAAARLSTSRVAYEFSQLEPGSTAMGRGTVVSTQAFVTLLVLGANVFLIRGDIEPFRILADRCEAFANRITVGRNLFEILATDMRMRLAAL